MYHEFIVIKLVIPLNRILSFICEYLHPFGISIALISQKKRWRIWSRKASISNFVSLVIKGEAIIKRGKWLNAASFSFILNGNMR